jgi:superfamily II DNA or RNA helicase
MLRPYQQRAFDSVLDLWANETRRVLLVLPTGGGKTVVASAFVLYFLAASKRVLMLAHRRELIKQAFCKMVRNGVDPSSIGIIMAGTSRRPCDSVAPPPSSLSDEKLWDVWARSRPGAPVQIGSIDTFRNHVAPPVDVVIVDEAHRSLAKSYSDVQLAYPKAWHLGLTATPFRADGKGLGDAYDDLVVAATYLELIAEGFLVRPICYGAEEEIDLSKVRRRGNDYDEKALAEAVDKTELVGDIVEHWRRRGNDAPTFCFAVNVQHSKHIAERFRSAGIPAQHVDGNTETAERDDAVAALRSGRVRVLCNCNVFCEGTDVPEVKTIILARPTLSEGLSMQQVGRGSRVAASGLPFVVLDHARHFSSFGLPHWPREYSLEGRKRRERGAGAATPVKPCPKCFALLARAAAVCDGCGHEFTAEEVKRTLEEVAGELKEIKDKAPEPKPAPTLSPLEVKRLAHWDEIVVRWRKLNAERRAAGERLYAGHWVTRTWRNESGRPWPPKGSTIPELTSEELAWSSSAPVPRGAQVTINGFEPSRVAPRLTSALEEWSL